MDFSAVQALMSTVVSLVHPAKALWLMEVSPAGSVMAGSSVQAAKAALPYADGFYLMTPFNRVALMERLIARLNEEIIKD